MLIKNIGGEFALIERLQKIIPTFDESLIVSIGDDAAVIKTSRSDEFLLVTTDMLVSGEHFDKTWSTPQQIGIKAVECNVSDIAAMGGTPTFLFISIALTKDTTVEWIENLYSGISESCKKYGIFVAGGDTVKGPTETLSITALGTVSQQNLCLRGHAKPGDLLGITGTLGASAAALRLHQQHQPVSAYLEQKHLAPTSRLASAQKIAPLVNAMIDISDGLASEINHICQQSKVGAVIFEKDIPVHRDVQAAAKTLNIDPMDLVLHGGEDYELLFTFSRTKLEAISSTLHNFFIIGEITSQTGECYLITKTNRQNELAGGYDHFF